MRLEKQFQVKCTPEAAAELAARDETLMGLFPDKKVEIVERDGARRTVLTHYTALGRSGTATFHFDCEEDGTIRFEKVCDGRVWRELRGSVSFAARRGGTRVTIRTDGRTKSLVPEIAIKGPMRDELDQMAAALRARLESTA